MEPYEQIKLIKDRYSERLMQKANVVGVGIGFAEKAGTKTDEICLVVMVNQKVPEEKLDPDDVIPREIEGVRVDVQNVGELKTLK